MIVKSLSRKANSGKLLQYIICKYVLNDEKQQENDLVKAAKNRESILLKHHVRARTLRGVIREFKENESYRLVRRNDSVAIFHTIISFSPKDRKLLNDNILKDITRKFIEERGTNCLHVAAKHEDKDHLHVHICTSGTQLNGRSARVSNQQFRSLKLSLERYQRETYPFLVHSQIEHYSNRQKSKEISVSRLKSSRQTKKAQVLEVIEKVLSKAKSREDFISRLSELGHEPYLRNGELQGVLYNGEVKFRFSRLGFDTERLEQLDRMHDTEKAMSQLYNLRKGILREPQEMIAQSPPEVVQPMAAAELSELEALAAIRDKSNEKELEYDDIDERTRTNDMSPFAEAEDDLNFAIKRAAGHFPQ